MQELAAVGDVLAGKYRVDKILGIGGMGMVVAATHLELDQRVALKFMLPSSHESAETSGRFLREARAAGRLNSDHVCRVMDVGRFDNGAPYIVMEYLQGENLAAVLRRRGPMRVSEAVDYILQAIEGLAEAHAHGIIHRDLKPDNLFLAKRNDGAAIVKVLDFGISKVGIGVSTKTGDIMGSPAYMAPEQMESSRNVDQRADVWSLGVVLYQLVAGKPPFRGDTLPLLCMHVVNDDPPPMSVVRGDLPDGFEAAVMKCLEKEPVDRYADVGDLATALAPFGPANATTSASRIQIVLRRARDSSVVIEPAFPLAVPVAVRGRRPTTQAPSPPRVEPETTMDASAGQTMSTMRTGRASWGLAAVAVAALGIVAMVVVALWRGDGNDLTSRGAAPAPAVPVAKPGPIVEPIEVPAAPPPPPLDPRTFDPPPVPATTQLGGGAPVVEPHTDGAVPTLGPAPGKPGAGAPPKVKRRRIRRVTPAGARPGSGSGDVSPGVGSGSAEPPDEPDDDDKWTHMTHDEKQP